MNELRKHKHSLHSSYFHPLLRDWQEMAGGCHGRLPCKRQIVYPLFVLDGELKDEIEAISSMPGIQRLGKNRLISHLTPLIEKGLRSVLLFGVLGSHQPHLKDSQGSRADHIEGPVLSCVELLRKTFPNLLIICDVCLCDYTHHGHCGILEEDGSIHHEKTIKRLTDISLAYARAGAHIIAPSDMMDHRIESMKSELRKQGLNSKVAIMSYSAKFASCFYGPFREAAHSAPSFGDRKAYQLPPGSRGLALRALVRNPEYINVSFFFNLNYNKGT
jgi:porphobilinogen synthase